jgi:hypothetical protein
VPTDEGSRVPSLEELGLPEHSALTIEGRIERVDWRGDWLPAMVQIVGVLALVVTVAVVLSLVA